jgi:hypothetical protein
MIWAMQIVIFVIATVNVGIFLNLGLCSEVNRSTLSDILGVMVVHLGKSMDSVSYHNSYLYHDLHCCKIVI